MLEGWTGPKNEAHEVVIHHSVEGDIKLFEIRVSLALCKNLFKRRNREKVKFRINNQHQPIPNARPKRSLPNSAP